jgi:hypothetical protein
VRADQRDIALEREELEREWYSKLEWTPRLEAEVVGSSQVTEPRHRFLPYRQGFAPALVRRFLSEAQPEGTVLDPFGESGTTAIELARAGRRGVSVELMSSLVHITQAAVQRSQPVPDLPALPPHHRRDAARGLARAIEHPAHLTALLMALVRTLKADGARKRGAPDDLRPLVKAAFRMMQADQATKLPGHAQALRGDARALPFRDESIGGVLTSPPYLSRFDYEKTNALLEKAYRFSQGRAGSASAADQQVRSFRQGSDTPPRLNLPGIELHPAAIEASEELVIANHAREAGVVCGYFEDMGLAVREMARVLAPGAPLWLVIGGAFVHEVYVPSDLILCERLEAEGFTVERLDLARDLAHSSGRRLGTLTGIVPREVILRARRS